METKTDREYEDNEGDSYDFINHVDREAAACTECGDELPLGWRGRLCRWCWAAENL